jgi:hypothetical protein
MIAAIAAIATKHGRILVFPAGSITVRIITVPMLSRIN